MWKSVTLSATLWIVFLLNTSANAGVVCRQRPIDVLFLLDGSRSVRPRNFQVIKDYVKNFTSIFNEIGPNAAQIGVVQFASTVREEIRLNQYSDRTQLFQAIEDIEYMRMGTMTGEALKYMVTQGFTTSHGARLNNPDIHQVAVVITDGKSQDYGRGTVTKWQREAKNRGIELYGIGVGKRANDRELLEIASEPKYNHKFHADNFEGIKMVGLSLEHLEICDEDECADGTDECDQICNNTIGSYVCSCNEGFVLQEDERSCEPVPAPTPSNLQFSEITHTSSRVQWEIRDISHDLVSHYLLVFTRSDGTGENTIIRAETTTANLVDLDPAVEYDVSVSTVTASDFSQPARGSFTTLSLGGTTVTITDRTLTTLTVQWTPAGGDGLTGYEVFYQEVLELNGGVAPPSAAVTRQCGPDVHEMVLTGLEPATTYFVRVIPKHGELAGETGVNEDSTDQLQAPVVNVIDSSLTVLAAEWNAVNYPAQSWRVEVFADETQVKVLEVPGDQIDTVIDELQPSTQYDLEVIGNVTEGGRNFLTPKGKATGRTKELMAPEVNIVETGLSNLTVEWSEINMDVDSWTVKCFPKGRNKQFQTAEISGDLRTAVFQDLLLSTLYKVEVLGHVTESGRTFASPKGRARDRTKEMVAPTVTITSTSFTSMDVGWDDPGVPVDTWSIKLFDADNGELLRDEIIDGSESEISFDGLQQNTNYRVEVKGRVSGVKVTHDSPSGIVSDATLFLTAPEVNCTATTASSVAIQWSDVNVGVDSWTVKIYPAEMEVHVEVFEQASDVREYVFLQLQPSTSYTVEVTGNVIEEDFTVSSQEGTDFCITNPSSPRNIEVVERGMTELVVSFDPSRGEVDNYDGECTPEGGDSSDAVKGEFTSDLVMQCSDLDPATTYDVNVISVFRTLESDPISISNTTLTPPPSGLTLLDPSTHTILAEWQAPEADSIDRYYVTYNSSYDDVEVRIVEGSQTSILLTDLEPNTQYTVHVETEINEETSIPDIAEESTLPEIINLQIDDVGYTSISVSWNPSEVPHLQSYCLKYSQTATPDDQSDVVLSSETVSYTLTELETATEYKLAINARYSRSESEESERFATTLALPPIGPLTFSNVTETSFVAHWLPPEGASDPPSYDVTYFTEGSLPVTIENVEDTNVLIDELDPTTTYNVTVTARYQDDLISQPIAGNETTSSPDPTSCSCTTYLRTQSQMQSMLVQMMQQIDVLNQKIDALTSRNARSVREIRNHRRKRRI